jgi:tRNA threonylcarbamoyladenosine biosynthesis protein TsaB
MTLLALETSTEFCSVALLGADGLHWREVSAGRTHSDILLDMVDQQLLACGVQLQDIDGIAFGAGPGSFTGVRIACAVAQGLALATGKPVLAVSTLEAMAEASGATAVACALDARLGELYLAAYLREEAGWTTRITPGLYARAALPALPPGEWIGCGSGYVAEAQLHAAWGVTRVVPGLHPRADAIARLGAAQLQAGKGIAARDAAPLYLRDKVAQTLAERRA